MTEICGNYDPAFAQVVDAFEKNFEEGDLGACCAVFVDGQVVVDIWGGIADFEKNTLWEKDTIVNVWSTTKTMAAICTLMLYDRGLIDLESPVYKYWDIFAQNGKENVLISHLLSHSAGLPGFDSPITEDQLFDWDYTCNRLASQATWWDPGSVSGYHPMTQGWLLGEVVRRVDGRTLGNFFREEVAEKIGADFHIGLSEKHFDRVALLDTSAVDGPVVLTDETPHHFVERVEQHGRLGAKIANSDRWRKSEFPAANGHGNARSVAFIHNLIACNGASDEFELLSPDTVKRIFEIQTDDTDLILGVPIRHGMGFGLRSDLMPISPNENACFWGGWGGSLAVIDVDARMSFAYVMNRMAPSLQHDMRAGRTLMATHAALASS
ncbi:MAG: serine hydrolase domain-containing protein [Actinomycetota bacterium]|nr:serine hydrolase domain-containing protein [Actinomycetota bacterium]|tara:strand:+ start:169 stop:1311 length:1143 start_codon:yes stop_codon:yes gene_type:complete